MPLYEYECLDCGHRSEEIQRLADPPLETCPACGGRYRKQLSAPAFQFKGSGWYVTDYARSGKGAEGKAKDSGGSESKSDKGSSESSSAASESKPAEAKPTTSGTE